MLCYAVTGTHLFVDQETAKGPFRLRVKLPPVTTSLTLKGRGNTIKCFAQGHKQTCRLSSTLTLLNAEAVNTNL